MGFMDRVLGVAGRRFLKLEGFFSASVTDHDMVRVEFREALTIEIRRATGVLDKLQVPKPGPPEVMEIPLKELLTLGGKADEQRKQVSDVSSVQNVESSAQ